MADYWLSPQSRPAKRRLTATTILRDAEGEIRIFAPGDDVPNWAKDQMGGHLWGVKPKRVPGRHYDIAQSRVSDVDGLPDVIDVVCRGLPVKAEHRPTDGRGIHGRKIVRRFEVAALIAYDSEPPRWEWWINRRFGELVEQTETGGAPQYSESPRPDPSGKWIPGGWSPAALNFECVHHTPTRRSNPSWSTLREVLDLYRHQGRDEVLFEDLIYTSTR